jgi:hypothetical protein
MLVHASLVHHRDHHVHHAGQSQHRRQDEEAHGIGPGCYAPRRPDFWDVEGGLTFGALTTAGFGAALSFRNLSMASDFGPFEEKSGMPRGDFFFMACSPVWRTNTV